MENMVKGNLNKTQLNVVGIEGDSISMVYLFKCNCELHSNYKNYYHIANDCPSHTLSILVNHVLQISDWSEIPSLE